MKNNDQSNERFEQGKSGTGSAEQTGRDRYQQKNQNTELTQSDKQDIADEIGTDSNSIADLRDLGALSGRDDAAGGSGDDMSAENTNEGTDR